MEYELYDRELVSTSFENWLELDCEDVFDSVRVVFFVKLGVPPFL